MAIFKCKMCGGTLDINNNETVAVCEYCGSKQTVPTKSSEVITNLFNRANNLRLKNEFDKAAEIYGKILDEDDTNSEAHWCLLLCKYGIEYVEDPKTYKRIPTCHRAQYTSVLTDPDYIAAVENADAVSKEVYTEQAHEISELQKSILAIVKNEKPFDVFICYKESDENGKRTVDSALANDIYYQLTKEGLRVFYAAITLEDKLGQEYEPYIFAALNTAKVMLVIGTKPEYFEAVWVRNEWSRFLALMKTDRDKMLIPCYRDMDAYELPEEFAHLQAQDMAKIGFINDLVRGIKKVTAKDEPKPEQQTVIQQVGSAGNMQALLKRGYMALEDGEWDRADGFFEEVLNLDAECAEAYLGKLLAKNKLTSLDSYANRYFDKFCNDILKNGKKVTLTVPEEIICDMTEKYSITNYFSKDEIAKQYRSIVVYYKVFYDAAVQQISNLKNAWKNDNLLNKVKRFAKGDFADVLAKSENELFDKAENHLAFIKTKDEEEAQNAKEILSSQIAENQAKTKECYDRQIKQRETDYADYCNRVEAVDTLSELNELLEKFGLLEDYKDSVKKVAEIKKLIEKKEEEEKAERARKEEEEKVRKKAEEERKQLKKKQFKKQALIVCSSLAAVFAVLLLISNVIIPNVKYNNAVALMNEGKYDEAISAFESFDGYKDSADKIDKCNTAIINRKYDDAVALMNEGKYDEAISAFEALDGYKDSADKIDKCNTAIINRKYDDAVALMNEGEYDKALSAFKALDGYKDSADKIDECNTAILAGKYNDAVALIDAGEYIEAFEKLITIDEYKDSAEKAKSIYAKYEREKLKSAKTGDYLYFGSYEQDNKTSNGEEYIAWLVLKVKDGKALVISKYALDCKPYNTSYTDVTWETCTLRKWLNNDFINSAFSSDEKAMISKVTVSADKNPEYSTNPGNATQDQVFLLSITEAEKYFTTYSARRCFATVYAKAQGATCSIGRCWWWLRSPGDSQYGAAYVLNQGRVYEIGHYVDGDFVGVRPAMWIDLS